MPEHFSLVIGAALPAYMSYVFAAVLGIGLGWLMVRNKDVDYTKVRTLSKEDFKSNMRRGQLVDIRSKKEYELDKIKGARNYKASDFTSKYAKIRKDKPVYLYCANGRKSKRIAKKMIRKQFSAIYVLKDGFNSYKKL